MLTPNEIQLLAAEIVRQMRESEKLRDSLEYDVCDLERIKAEQKAKLLAAKATALEQRRRK